MPGLVSLLLAIWMLVSPQLTVSYLDGPVRFTDLYGNTRTAEAALACPPEGQPELLVSPSISLHTLIHELAHAYDCQDDGALNGSPTTRPATRPSGVSDYCWDSDAEWYACSVLRYRSIHADEVARWAAPISASTSATKHHSGQSSPKPLRQRYDRALWLGAASPRLA